MELKATFLIDNNASEGLIPEWGLSVLIEYRRKRVLLDTGASGKFAENARALGIDLSSVDYGVLSHAHYDHSDGMEDFFAQNSSADFYLRRGSGEDAYSGDGEDRHYIGIRKGILSRFAHRIRYADGIFELFEGAYLIPHSEDMEQAGRAAKMYILRDGEWLIDLFGHEQSLVFDTAEGLVIFNSCCHGGADIIIKEAERALGKKVVALIGGLHLFRSKDKRIIEMAQALRDTGIRHIITGHCTGDRALSLLEQELPDIVRPTYAGMVVDF